MKKIKNSIIISVFMTASLQAGSVYAGSDGATGAQFLELSPGAAAVAMGDNYTAAADNIYSIYYNPASAAWLRKQELDITYLKFIQGSNYHYLGYLYPVFERLSVAAELTFDADKQFERDALGNKIGNINNRDFSFAATAGYFINDNISVGLKSRYIYQKLYKYIENSFSFDVGARFRTPVPGVYVGASVRNIGPDLTFISQGSPQPLNFNIGGLFEFPGKTIRVTADIHMPKYSDFYGGVGIEYSPVKNVMLRGGYKYDPGFKLSQSLRAGVGFREKNWELDYAYENFSDLGVTHRVSLIARFNLLPDRLAVEDIPPLPIPFAVYDFQGENVNHDLLWMNEALKDILIKEADKYPDWFKPVTMPDVMIDFDPDNFHQVRKLGDITDARYIIYGIYRGDEQNIRLIIRVADVVKGRKILEIRKNFPMSDFIDAAPEACYNMLERLLDYRHKRFKHKL